MDEWATDTLSNILRIALLIGIPLAIYIAHRFDLKVKGGDQKDMDEKDKFWLNG